MFSFFKKSFCLLFISLLFATNIKNVISKLNSDRLLAELFDLSDNEFDIDEGNYDLVIKFKNGFDDDLVTDLFATAHNLERVARIIELNDNSLFHFKLRDSDKKHRRRRKRYLSNKIDKLQEDERIEYVLIQPYLKREKRANLLPDEYYIDDEDDLNQEIKRIYEQLTGNEKKNDNKIINQTDDTPKFNDKEYGKEWYLINNGQLNTPKDHDLNVKEAWLKGFTGRNVTIVIIDDGLDHEHPDFAGKYVSLVLYYSLKVNNLTFV
jgi:subtilisin family serine protease